MNIKKSLLRWTVAALAVLMLAACGSSTTSQPTTSSPATENNSVQKAQTGQVSFNVQFPQAAIKKALMDNRTVSVNVQWFSYNNGTFIGSVTLTPDASGLASATVDVPVGNMRFMATAQDSNLVELDKVSTAGEITSGSNTVTMTFLGGDWQFVDASDNPLPQTFGTTTLAGFTMKSEGVYFGGDSTKPQGWSDYQLQWQDSTTAIGPLMWAGQTAQFNASVGTGNSFGSDWLNITAPSRSNSLNGDSPYLAGDRLVWLMDWEDGPETIVDANNVDLIPQFQTFGNTQVLDGNHLGGHLMAMTFDSLTQSAPIATNVDCNPFWYAQPATPAAARATAIKASLTKSATKAAIGDDTTLTAGTATATYTDCIENTTAAQIDGDGDGDNLYEELTYDANGNWRYDAGDIYIDGDNDGKFDYTYKPGTTYDVTEVYSNVVAREFRAKGSQTGSVFTPPAPVAPTAFSADWLNGKTLYQVWYGEGYDSSGNLLPNNVPVVAEVTFNNGTIIYSSLLNGGIGGSTTYAVNVFGMLYTNGDATSGNTIVSGSTAQYIKTHYTIDNGLDNVDLYFFNQADAMAYASGLTASIPASSATSALGTWMKIDPATNEATVLAFVDSSKYLMGEDGTPDAGGGPGVEVGTYSFNPVTAETTFSVTYETNGDWGPAKVDFPATYPISDLSDIVMTVVDPAEFSSFSFNRVTNDPLNPIIGSWHFSTAGSDGAILVLLNNGQYYAIQADETDTNNRFFESGYYTWDSGTGTFIGTGVFSSNPSNSAVAAPSETNTLTINVSGDTLTLTDVDGTATATRL